MCLDVDVFSGNRRESACRLRHTGAPSERRRHTLRQQPHQRFDAAGAARVFVLVARVEHHLLGRGRQRRGEDHADEEAGEGAHG